MHATGQVAHADLPADVDPAWLVRRLARLLPVDVRVRAVTPVPPAFDARFSALRRHYRYRVATAPSGAEPLRARDTLAWPHALDVDAVNAASALAARRARLRGVLQAPRGRDDRARAAAARLDTATPDGVVDGGGERRRVLPLDGAQPRRGAAGRRAGPPRRGVPGRAAAPGRAGRRRCRWRPRTGSRWSAVDYPPADELAARADVDPAGARRFRRVSEPDIPLYRCTPPTGRVAGVSTETDAALYGDKIVAVEPGGNERVADADRHGRPRQLFWTWTSPNMEFATIFVGVLAVEVFGLTFGQAVAAIVLGNVLAGVGARRAVGARAAGRGAADGAGPPRVRLPRQHPAVRADDDHVRLRVVRGQQRQRLVRAQLADRRVPGRCGWCRRARAGRGRPTSGTTWCRRSSGGRSRCWRWCSSSARWSCWRTPTPSFVPAGGGTGGLGGFLLTVGAVFGYTAGWTPYAADYTRYLPETVSRWATGLAAGVGNGLVVHRADDRRSGVGERGGPGRRHVGQPHHGLRRRAAGLAGRAHVDRDRHRRRGRERPQHLLGGDGVPDDGDPGAPEAGARVRGAGVRGGRVPHRARSARRRGGQLRELPPRDRLLDRAVARRDARRPVAAAWPHRRSSCSTTARTPTRPG